VFGGRVAAGAVVTWTLVCVNVVFYLAEWAYPSIVTDLEMVGRFPLAPLAPLLGVADGQWYRLITSAFLHEPGLSGIGPAHILFNMWALVVVGPALEQSLGRLRYLALYLLSALGGSVLIYFIGQADAPSLGASGAIFGLFGAWFVVSRRLRLDSRGIIVLIVLNLAISFAIPHVAWQAHLGGLVTGGALTAAYAYAPRKQRMAVQAAATIAVLVLLVLLVIAVVVRNHQLAGPAF
jgi:membrane associated rhomboid family serine protease